MPNPLTYGGRIGGQGTLTVTGDEQSADADQASAPPTAAGLRTRHDTLIASIGGTAVVVLALLFFLLRRRGSRPRP